MSATRPTRAQCASVRRIQEPFWRLGENLGQRNCFFRRNKPRRVWCVPLACSFHYLPIDICRLHCSEAIKSFQKLHVIQAQFLVDYRATSPSIPPFLLHLYKRIFICSCRTHGTPRFARRSWMRMRSESYASASGPSSDC